MVYDQLYLVFLCLYYSLDNLQSATATKMDSMFQAFFTCLRVVSRVYSRGVFFFGFFSFCLSESWKPDRVCIIIQYRASFSGRRIVQTLSLSCQ